MAEVMTEWEAFYAQSKSDLTIYKRLVQADRSDVPSCHPLHYLQMASEKLAKAVFIKLGVNIERGSHVAFSRLFHSLRGRRVGERLGYRSEREFEHLLRQCSSLMRQIDELCPAVGPQQSGGGPADGPNVEYPWESRAGGDSSEWRAPADHNFGLLEELGRSPWGRLTVQFIERLQDRIDTIEA